MQTKYSFLLYTTSIKFIKFNCYNTILFLAFTYLKGYNTSLYGITL